MKTQELRNRMERLKGERDSLIKQKEAAIKSMQNLDVEIAASEEAKLIIRTVAKKTQDKLRAYIEEPVSLAMAAVFDDPYQLRLEMNERKDRTECDFKWIRSGKEYDDLMFSAGGGYVDVAAFGLQIAVLGFMRHSARPILILDEPLKYLKGSDLPERGAMMISAVAKELGITVLMVSHIPEQKAGADKLIHVSLKPDGTSAIKEEINVAQTGS